jgi:hypothetical protein
MQQLLLQTDSGYAVLCSTGCAAGNRQTDIFQWSDVIAFQNGPNGDTTFVQIFLAPFSQDFLTIILPCVTFSGPCLLPDGTHPPLLDDFQNKQLELTVYYGSNSPKGILKTVGRPLDGLGSNTFNIISAAAPEPESWNLLVLALTAFALVRGLWRDHRRRHTSQAPPEPSASSELR